MRCGCVSDLCPGEHPLFEACCVRHNAYRRVLSSAERRSDRGFSRACIRSSRRGRPRPSDRSARLALGNRCIGGACMRQRRSVCCACVHRMRRSAYIARRPGATEVWRLDRRNRRGRRDSLLRRDSTVNRSTLSVLVISLLPMVVASANAAGVRGMELAASLPVFDRCALASWLSSSSLTTIFCVCASGARRGDAFTRSNHAFHRHAL